LLEKRVKIQLYKLFIKKGFGLKSHCMVNYIIFLIKKTHKINSFKYIANVLKKILPYTIVKTVQRGKHKILLLLPITFCRAFHISFKSLKNNALLRKKKIIQNKKFSFADTFTHELLDTDNKKSDSYKQKIAHIKQVRLALSFR